MEEEKIPSNIKKQKSSLPLLTKPLPRSPQIGREVTLTTNYHALKMNSAGIIHLYSVQFLPEIEAQDTSLKRGVLNKLEPQLKEILGLHISTDTQIFSPSEISDSRVMTTPIPVRGKSYDVQITLSTSLSLNHVKNPHKYPHMAQSARNFFNCIVKKLLRANHLLGLGRTQKYYLPQNAKCIRDFNIEIWPGYKTSVNLKEAGLLLDVDFASKLIRMDSVLDFMKEIVQQHHGRGFQNLIKEELKGRSMLARYGNKRLYVIDDVEFDHNPETMTFTRNHKEISVYQYFKDAYSIEIKDPKQPLLLSVDRKTKCPRYFVPELGSMTGLPSAMREDFTVMKKVAEFTKLSPDRRIFEVRNLLKMFTRNDVKDSKGQLITPQPEDILKDWNLEINMSPLEIKGRVLPPQKLKLGDSKVKEIENSGTFQLRDPIVSPQSLTHWLLIHTNQDFNNASNFVDSMYKAAKTFGIGVEFPTYATSRGMKAEDYIAAFDENMKAELDFVVFLLPPQAKGIYSFLKIHMFLKGLPSQVIVSRTLQKNIMSVCSKIILQINAKRNGDLWYLTYPRGLPPLTMICGIDVSREGGLSVLSMTSSINQYFSKFYTQNEILKSKQEIAETLHTLIKGGVKYFHNATGRRSFPELIIVYRDGVGEGQKSVLFEQEVISILQAFQQEGSPCKPKLLFCTINKKIHTRLFCKSGSQSYGASRQFRGQGRGGSGQQSQDQATLTNALSGTIVDSEITEKQKYEFLLMPQKVTQGTGTPSHFHVLYDDSGLDVNVFQQLTNSLCYGYYNWCGAIRSPAPCKYALTSAKLISKYTKQLPPEALSTRLHYL